MQHLAATFRLHESPVDGNDIEGMVMKLQQEFGMEVMRRYLESLDEELYRHHPAEWVSEGKRGRTVETVVGTVTYSRRVYRHKVTSKLFMPVDEKAGFEPGQRMSERLKGMCASLAAEVSYRAVPKVLEKLRGVNVSAQSVHRSTQAVGEKRVEEVRKESRELYERPGQERGKGSGLLVIQVDSMFARSQRQKSKHVEMRLAATHAGWEKETPGGERWRLKDKQVVVDATGPEEFWDAVSSDASSRYDLSRCSVVVNGDGAEWVRKGLECFSGAVFQLDKFHWVRALRRAVADDDRAARVIRRALEREDWEAVEAEVRRQKMLRPDRAADLQEFLDYVSGHKGEVRDWRERVTCELDPDSARGLGAIESNIQSVLVKRFKKHRRRWTQAGANRLAYLVALDYNGRLDQWLCQATNAGRHPVAGEPAQGAVTRYRRYEGEDVSQWLQAHVPALGSPARPWTIALRGLVDARSSWAS